MRFTKVLGGYFRSVIVLCKSKSCLLFTEFSQAAPQRGQYIHTGGIRAIMNAPPVHLF